MAKKPNNEKLKKRALDALESCKADMDKLQTDRAEAYKFYKGEKLGNEIKGRSQVVMTDVADTIEWIKPSMMKIFYGGQNVVDVRPQGPEDELKAKLMEEKVNYDFQKGMNGFKVLYQFIHDALLYKMGVVKYYWKTGYEKPQEYKGISELDHMGLHLDPDLVEISSEEYIENTLDAMGIAMPVKKYNCMFGRKVSKPFAENLPPEEFIFDIRIKGIDDENGFVAHKKKVRTSSLKKYGITKADINAEIARFDDDPLVIERYKDLGGVNFLVPYKESPEEVYLYECYFNDFDENDNSIPKIVTIVGTKVIKVEDNKYGRPPFCLLSPILESHRLVGRSFAELVKEIQKIRTALIRNILDNIYFQNNCMKVVNPYAINADELDEENRPGGTIRTLYDTRPSDAIFNIPYNPLPPQVFKMFDEILPEIRQDATGVSKYYQGMDSRSLNKTATGISQIMNAAQQRVELIARIFAETGIKDLFQAFVDMNIDFFDMSRNYKINNEWKLIRREDIDGYFDVLVDVGIGTGSKEIAFNQKVQMLNIYQGVAKSLGPMAMAIVDLPALKELIREMWRDQGYKNPDKFLAKEGGVNGGAAQGTVVPPVGGGAGGPPAVGAPEDAAVLPGDARDAMAQMATMSM